MYITGKLDGKNPRDIYNQFKLKTQYTFFVYGKDEKRFYAAPKDSDPRYLMRIRPGVTEHQVG